jgi:GNAT superfamily N-acetyltransferase
MQLRPAEPGDALSIARVHVRAWQQGYRSLLPDDYLDQLRPEDRAQHYDFSSSDPQKPYTIVAVDGGSILGFATTAPSRDADLPDYGELWALHVDPDHWGRGVGRELLAAARARLFEIGFRKAFLWALVGNVRADRFYRIDGWALDGQLRTQTIWGITLNELRYQRDLEEINKM